MAGVSADLELAIDAALAQVDALEARLTEVATGVSVELTAEVDTGAAEAELDSLSVDPIDVGVTADTSAAEADLEGLDATPVEVEVEANTAAAEASLGDLASQASEVQDAASGAGAGLVDMAGAGALLSQAQSGVSSTGAGAVSSLLSSGGAAASGALGYGALATGIFSAVQAYGEAEAVGAITDQIITNQGRNAFTTSEAVGDLAGQIQAYSGFSDEAIQTGANFILTLGNIRNEAGEGNDVFDRTVALSADLARRMGAEVPAAANALGRALTDPERGLARLERSIGRLPEGVRNNILAFAEQGDTLSAQTALLDALEAKIGGVAEAYGETVPGELDRTTESLGEAQEALGEGFAPAVILATDIIDPFIDKLREAQAATEELGGIAGAVGPLAPLISAKEILSDGFGVEIIDGRQLLILDQAKLSVAGIGDALGDAAGEADTTADSMTDAMTATEELAAEVDGLRRSLDNLNGTQQSVDEGAIDVRNNQRDLLEALVDLNGVYREGTASGDRFLSTAQDLAGSIRDQTLRLLENGASAETARFAQEGYIAGLRRTLRQAGLTERQIDHLIDTYARVPDEQITKFETPGAAAAAAAAQNVKRQVDAIPPHKHIEITVGSNIGSVVGGILSDLQAVQTEAQQVADIVFKGAVDKSGGPGRSAGPQVVINQNIDARGSRDPELVGAAAARGARSALDAVDARVSVKLAQP